ncbi:hypothetical protein [Streptomyces sp. NPDC056600]|uniref:hypothetical protein n=1 Tax=Streptomyces sp. NPDC056600 TaxID=3345874 RepID=UPI0036ACE9CE
MAAPPAAPPNMPPTNISAKVPSNHGAILRKGFRAVADAVREVPAPDRDKR